MATRSSTAMLAVVVALCGGCVIVDGKLAADGSGTLEVTYRIPANSTEATERARFTSPHVTVKSVKMQPDRAIVQVAFDDATKLSTAEGLRALDVSRSRSGAEETLRVVITNPHPVDVRDEGREGPRVTLELPGPVADAKPQAFEVNGNRVIWRIKFVDYVRNATTELVVRYTIPSSSSTMPQAG